MSITSALKKLAKNVFNVNTTGDNIDEILDDIANNASSSGGGDEAGIVINSAVNGSTLSFGTLPTGLTVKNFANSYILAAGGKDGAIAAFYSITCANGGSAIIAGENRTYVTVTPTIDFTRDFDIAISNKLYYDPSTGAIADSLSKLFPEDVAQ